MRIPLALLFPGQGSQYVGMGEKLCSESMKANNIFNLASDTLGIDMKKMCFSGELAELSSTENTQPALLTLSYALFQAFMEEHEDVPSYLCGHSLGEITALTCSGAIDFVDALHIVRKRGELMSKAVFNKGQSAMVAISNINSEEVKLAINGFDHSDIVISNYNAPTQTVISGIRKTIEQVVDTLEQKGATSTYLNVSAPFHSPIMEPAAEEFRNYLSSYTFRQPRIEVLSNVTGTPHASVEEIPDLLAKQMMYPVQWIKCMDYMIKSDTRFFIELGPKNILTNLVKRYSSSLISISCENMVDMDRFDMVWNEEKKKRLAGVRRDLQEILSKCLAISVCTPNINYDADSYKKSVVDSYHELQHMYYNIDKYTLSEIEINKIILRSIELVKMILAGKKVSKEEIFMRHEQLVNTTNIGKYLDIQCLNLF